jgi:hypothetical protein
MSPGEEKAWEILGGLAPAEVCKNTQAKYDEKGGFYVLKSFGMDIAVDTANKNFDGNDACADLLLNRLGYFSRLSIVWYLVGAKDIGLSDKLLQPATLRGGQIFFRGSHVLPLDKLAQRYARDAEGFLKKGESLGGKSAQYGDAAVRLFPLPRVPVLLILWREDEEFPARVDILFDSSCEHHLALDVLWSVAMMSILIMM